MSIRTAAFWSMGSQYIAFIIQFAVSVIISRFFLAPAEMGLFSIALASAMMVSIMQDFGISRYLMGHAELSPSSIRTASSVSFLFGLIVAAIVVGVAYPASLFYGEPRLLGLLVTIGASYLLAPFSIVPVALLSRAMNFRAIFIVNLSGVITNGVVGLSLAYSGFSTESLAWAMVAQALVRASAAQILAPARIPFPLQLKGAMPIARFGSASTLLAISGAVGFRSPDLIIGRILGFAPVGLYGRASGLAAHLHMLVFGSIGIIFYPAFAKLRNEGEAFGPHYERVVAAYGAVVWPAMVLLAASAYPIISFLYGPKWVEAAPLLTFLALAEICFVALPLHMDIPILLGRIKTLIALNVVDTLASISTLIIAAQWGILAAAASRIAYGCLWYCIYARFMHGLVGFRWANMLKIYAKSAALCAATVAPLLLAYRFWHPASEIGFIAAIPFLTAGLIIWFAALFVLRHPARTEIIDMLAPFATYPGIGWLRSRLS